MLQITDIENQRYSNSFNMCGRVWYLKGGLSDEVAPSILLHLVGPNSISVCMSMKLENRRAKKEYQMMAPTIHEFNPGSSFGENLSVLGDYVKLFSAEEILISVSVVTV